MIKQDSNAAVDQEFQLLLVEVQDDLFAFIALMVGNTPDARELLQETNLALLNKEAQYDRTRPFRAWARSIAYYEVLTFRQKRRRERLVFNDAIFDRLSATVMQEDEDEDFNSMRRAALTRCLDKLTPNQRNLIDLRYYKRMPVGRLAQNMACTETAVSTLLYRIRRVLGECIRFEIARETVL